MAAPASDGFPGARELHGQISPDYWCVNRHDLRWLKRQVVAAIGDGKIVPTERDDFDPKDGRIGPSIYTVVDQYIKPVTANAGGMSWALMMHPKGLKCDLFVTHAWQEGLFEFVDKVLWSFPIGARHAWTCFLANPQNLDIADMIRCPVTSPFARALEQAPCMLVVPNKQGSIYTRLWCVYEAYLAYDQNKIIKTARPPIRGEVLLHELWTIVACLALGGFLSVVSNSTKPWVIYSWNALAVKICMLASTLTTKPRRQRFVNLLGLVLSGNMCGMIAFAVQSGQHMIVDLSMDNVKEIPEWKFLCFVETVRMLGFFTLAELDRIRAIRVRQQAIELKYRFTTIREASCTSPEDERNLRGEIAHCVEQVDEAIHTLILAGMSTRSLREARTLGVDVKDAGFIEYSFACLMMGWSIAGFWKYKQILLEHDRLRYFNFADKLLALAFVVYFSCAPPDVQAFAYRVMHKGGTMIAQGPIILCQTMQLMGVLDFMRNDELTGVIALVVWLVVFPIAVAGMTRVATRCGPRVATVLAARGVGCLQGVCCLKEGARSPKRGAAYGAVDAEDTEDTGGTDSDSAAAPSERE